nr:MAG: capsid protein [Cressdnaviricota sp.]
MPYGKRSFARRRTPAYRARRSTYRARTAPRRIARRSSRRTRPATQFPSQMMTKLKYNTHSALSVSSLGGASFAYSLNSPYDPQISSGGGSCSGYEQWAGMYENYLCYGAKFVLTAYPKSNTDQMLIGLAPVVGGGHYPSTTLAYSDWLTESKYAIYRVAPQYVEGNNYQPIRLKKYFSVKKLQQLSHLGTDTANFSGATAGDPPIQPVVALIIAFQDMSGDANVVYDICITYYTLFYNPKTSFDLAL